MAAAQYNLSMLLLATEQLYCNKQVKHLAKSHLKKKWIGVIHTIPGHCSPPTCESSQQMNCSCGDRSFVFVLAGHLSLHRHRQRGGKEGQVLHRSKRGWVWNQFFVIEEYTGPDPVLVGRVSNNKAFLHTPDLSSLESNLIST